MDFKRRCSMIVDFKKNSSVKFLKRPKIFYPLLLLCIVASVLFLDKPFALFFVAFRSDWTDLLSSLLHLFTPYLTLIVLPCLFFFARFLQRRERKSRKLWYLSFATAVPLLVASILTVVFGRASPERLFMHNEMPFHLFDWDPAFRSFPSLLSCNIAAWGTALSRIYPKRSLRFSLGGFFVGLLPAALTTCFFSDALAGIAIGSILAGMVFTVMRRELSFS